MDGSMVTERWRKVSSKWLEQVQVDLEAGSSEFNLKVAA